MSKVIVIHSKIKKGNSMHHARSAVGEVELKGGDVEMRGFEGRITNTSTLSYVTDVSGKS